jgi:hypothetical protein
LGNSAEEEHSGLPHGRRPAPFQGEVLPYRENRIEVDETLRDDAGIPGIRFHFRYRENEQAMFADMMETGEELLKAACAEYFPPKNPKWTP